MRFALILTSVALAVFGARAPSAAQTPDVFNFSEVETLYGPMGIGYRQLRTPENGFTHRIVIAHPIWGYGIVDTRYRMNCANRDFSGSLDVWYWTNHGTQPARLASEGGRTIHNPLGQVFGSNDRKKNLIQAIVCGTGPFHLSPIQLGWRDLVQRLSAFAGPAPQPWRIHTFREGHSPLRQGAPARVSMRFALPGDLYSSTDSGTPPVTEGGPPIGGTSSAEWDAPWGRGAFFQVATQRYRVQPGFSAQNRMDAIVREEVGDFLVRRFDIRRRTDYLLTQIFAADEDGVARVIHVWVCTNRPEIAYAASAPYTNVQEQQIALRFANDMSAECS